MAVGGSGRIVVHLDPELKQRLHARLRSDGMDLKGWLVERARAYLDAAEGSRASGVHEQTAPSDLSETQRHILDAMNSDTRVQRHAEELMQMTGLRAGDLQAALVELELRGCVVYRSGLYRPVRRAGTASG
ncbi:MAG: hypothetical protein JOZ69_19620 [Myxococcales bacterium]|nr:hypothetical protein [Myxococcales bacterium]